jgi:hypothetical protein
LRKLSFLEQDGQQAPFDEMERGEGFDMFCPFGQNRIDGWIDGRGAE